MKVPYLELPKEFNNEALWARLKEQFTSCQFILGPEVERFEAGFARLCGARWALGLNSGADALFLAMKALGVESGDEVITAPNSFVATAGTIVACGARPVFVDVGPDYNLDPAFLEAAITPRTRAVMPVHLTGTPADMGRILEITRRHGLAVVEDAAQAVGATVDGKAVGSFGDAGCFSLHPLKNLNVCGDGGALTTSDEKLMRQVKLLRNHGLKNRDEIECFGYNSRLDTLQACIANWGLEHLDSVTQARIRNARWYDEGLRGLEDRVKIPPRRPGVRSVFHTYVVRVKDRERLIAYLAENGVETKIHYPVPIHLQPPCAAMGYRPGQFPVCEAQGREILSLPVHQFLDEGQIQHVIRTVKRYYGA